ncbi:metal-dependent hydrolase [Azorhizobium oxalatiphilum]|uniref:Metal-dependent hydrolase n=1 Tax=Azorhizobium oxalatiphilum TaxID=980631 RepID=A0A917C846_9HYPH|nr:metal-dependent hydrolase [Azorhizobium oxalatiphilum]
MELALDAETLKVEIRRHPTAQRLTLRVRAASRDVTLTAPPHVSYAAAATFVQRHREWVRVRLGRLPEGVPFVDGAIIPLRGEPHRICHVPEARGTVWEAESDDGEKLLCVAGDEPHVARRVADYLKRLAKADFTEASRRHAAALKVEIGRITLRDTSSRWGSCSSDGDLSYSWRLILAPGWVLDYLAAHECCHRLEMNHSPRYWRLVESIYPERRAAEAWLRANGAGLHRYGAE